MKKIDYYKQLVAHHCNAAKLQMLGSGARKLAPNEFRISSLYQCSRRLWLDKHYPEKAEEMDIDFANVKSGVLPGTQAHHLFQWWDKNHRVPKESVVEWENEAIKLTGHIDQDTIHHNVLVDYKTVGMWGWKYTKGLKPHHFDQINTYAVLTEKPYFIVVYLKKEDYEHRIFGGKSSRWYFDHVTIPKLEAVLAATEVDELPTTEITWECRYCPYKQLCKECEKTYEMD